MIKLILILINRYHEEVVLILVSWFFVTSLWLRLSSQWSSERSLCFLQSYGLVDRFHLWYTLPWAFNELVQLPIPDKQISQLQVLQPSRLSTILTSSRLVRMDSICNEVSPILLRSPIVFPSNIEELNLFCCDRNIDLKLPSLHHLTVVNSLDALQRCASISMNIQSITLVLDKECIRFATGDWRALRFLRALPHLRSLRVVLYDLYMFADDLSCQIIAETTLWLVDFAFSFRCRDFFYGLDDESAFKRCCSFIQQLQQTIFSLSTDEKLECCVEKDGCGLMIWRTKPYRVPIHTVWTMGNTHILLFLIMCQNK